MELASLIPTLPSEDLTRDRFKDFLLVSLLEDFCHRHGLPTTLITTQLQKMKLLSGTPMTTTPQDRSQYLEEMASRFWPPGAQTTYQPYQSLIQSRLAQEFSLLQPISEDVFRVQHRLDQQTYVVKRVYLDPELQEQPLQEVRILASLSHPNLIRYHTSWLELYQGELYLMIQMEDCPGELSQALSDSVSEETYLKIFHQLSQGLSYLHQQKLLHQDLKPSNLLYRYDDRQQIQPKIADLGHAQRISSSDSSRSLPGTDLYSAPEHQKIIDQKIMDQPMMDQSMIDQPMMNQKSDLYSLGLSMYELVQSPTPYQRLLTFQQLRQDLQPLKSLRSRYPRLYPLLRQLLQPNPRRRLRLSTLLSKLNQFTSVDASESPPPVLG